MQNDKVDKLFWYKQNFIQDFIVRKCMQYKFYYLEGYTAYTNVC